MVNLVFSASLIWFVMEVLLMVFVRMGWWRRRKSFSGNEGWRYLS
jgi:hypothetical protein